MTNDKIHLKYEINQIINNIIIHYYIFVTFAHKDIPLMHGIYLFIYDAIKFFAVEIREAGEFVLCVKNLMSF